MYKTTKHATRENATRPRIETLEDRRLLSATVNSISVINAATDSVIGTLNAGQTINLADYSDGISLRANVNSQTKSVKFGVGSNPSAQVENFFPYAIAGDKNGNYNEWKATPGKHTIKVTPFTQSLAKGTPGSTLTYALNVVNDPNYTPPPVPNPSGSTGAQVTSFSLIDPTTNKVIRTINNGDTVDLATMANDKSIAIRANANAATRSVRFGWDSNTNYRLEVGAPFSLSGDSNNDYWSVAPSLGKHYVTATAYGNDSGTGTGNKASLSFTVIKTAGGGGPVTTPVNGSISVTPATNGNAAPSASFVNPYDNAEQAYPGHYVVRVGASDRDGSVKKVELFVGNTLFDSTAYAPYSFAWKDVAAGTYTLTARVTDNDGAQKVTSITVKIKNPTVDDVFYVSTGGSDGNSGSSTGSALRTISKAASLAGPGDVVIILPGTYRESVSLKNSGTATAPITFKAQTPGTVFIDGADAVTGWSNAGGSVYSANWSKDFFLGGLRYHPDVPLTGYAEQFVYEGKALTQVTSRSSLSVGEFYVDWNANKVYTWLPNNDDPRSSGSTVWGSTRQTLFTASSTTSGEYITVDGLNFRHAANFPQQPAVRTSEGWVVKNVKIDLTNAVSFGFYGDNVYVSNLTISNSGHTGLTGQGVNALLNKVTLTGNNTKKFRWTWESGGGKLTRTDGLYVLNMNTYNNFGAGLWLDIYNTNFVVDGGFFHDNKPYGNDYEGLGVFVELSTGPGRIENVSAYGHSGASISISESTNITVSRNYLADYFEIRNMSNRGMSVRNIGVYNNYFKNAKFVSSIGDLDINSFDTLNINADYNTFDNGSDAWYNWKGKKYYNASSIYSALGVDRNARGGSVSIPTP